MMYDFDTIIDRNNTLSVKYDFKTENKKPQDVLPLWVADMDFRTPEAVRQALKKAADHGIYGYSEAKAPYYAAVTSWFERRFGWKADPKWIVKTPGVVYAVNTAVRALTQPGDAVLIQRPVYYPFSRVIESNGRKLVNNPLVYKDSQYTIDFEDFERK
ncbi:MAG: aminotransferase class I/II-fold pyridoxal phosphate-dependent enzyme, partial [Eubacterium sp.]|nr:aminotransferase class I/II-fold pyridoxal phosphate-dependent enzyme [Eubacterium sp.]